MYLAEAAWRQKKIRDKCNIHFYNPDPMIFPVSHYAKPLEILAADKGLNIHYEQVMKTIDKNRNEATF